MVLTELMIKRMKAPVGRRLEVSDSLAPGLVLRISTSGAKSWSVKYKVPGEGGLTSTGRPKKGKSRRLTLGTWPAMSLSAARDAAATAGRQAAGGADPRRARHQSADNSVAAVAADMVRSAKLTVETWEKMETCLNKHVIPTLGHRPIAEVSWPDVRALLDQYAQAGRAGTAREIRKHLSRLFSWSADRGLIETHPMAGRRAKDLQREEVGRSLSLEEARAVFCAAGELAYLFGPLYKLLLLTGARKSEWGEASWSEIEGDRLVIPRSRFKSRREHSVPLPEAALKTIRGIPRWSGPYIFSSTEGHSPVGGWSRAKSRLDTISKVSGYRIHDLRVTVRTQLSALGVAQEVAEAILGHSQGGLVGTYNKYQYEVEKRAALARWAETLTRV